jgi:hypothetical protein
MSRYTRCSIQIALRLDEDKELLGDVATTEAVVEGGVSEALAKFYDGTIIVDNVSIHYSQETFFYEDDLPDCA